MIAYTPPNFIGQKAKLYRIFFCAGAHYAPVRLGPPAARPDGHVHLRLPNWQHGQAPLRDIQVCILTYKGTHFKHDNELMFVCISSNLWVET